MAEPMTMVEAQKVLGREIKPATVEEDGYLVEYKDGYKSWSPKSVFDESYKSAETFLDRMKLEFESEVDKFNQYGHDGWELVQYNLIPPSALITASTIPCCGSIYILATFKKRLEK